MNITWDSNDYTNNFNFVYKFGEDVLSLIQSPKGSTVTDLGCGNGALTSKLSDLGYNVLGIDASREMLETAKKRYPHINFKEGDALNFKLSKKADVIFSNAVFHWIDDQKALLKNINRNLKTGGELVFEFGGKGCAEAVHGTLEKVFEKHGLKYPRVFFFPTIGEYAPVLENCGFSVKYAVLFDRPTPQKNGYRNG